MLPSARKPDEAFRLSVVPFSTSEYVKRRDESVSPRRQEILRKSRTIALSRLDGHWNDYFHEKQHFYQFIFSPCEIIPPTIPALRLNQSYRLLQHLLSNLEILASGVVQSHQSIFFEFLITSSIPALFGFFSSAEHIENAVLFYVGVVAISTKAKSEIACKIVFPFFKSALLFPFSESVFCDFIPAYLSAAARLQQSDDFLDHLCASFRSYNRLIEPAHKTVLGLMKERFGVKVCADFLIDVMHSFAVIFRGKMHRNHNETKQIRNLFDRLKESERHCSMLVSDFLEGRKMLRVPSSYCVFDTPLISFLMSTPDICRLASAYSLAGKLPQFWKDIDWSDIPVKAVFQVSFRTPTNVKRPVLQPLIFGENWFYENVPKEAIAGLKQRATAFENFLEDVVFIQELDKWLDILSEYEHREYFSTAVESAKGVETTEIGYEFLRLPSPVPANSLKQEQFLTILQVNKNNLLRGKEGILQEMEKEWGESMKMLATDEISFPSKRAEEAFRHVTWLLGTVDTHELSLSLKRLFRAVSDLRIIAEFGTGKSPDELLIKAVQLVSPSFVRFFVVICSFAMKRAPFRALLKRTDLTAWNLFEEVMVRHIQQNDKLLSLYRTLLPNASQSAPELSEF